MGRPKRKTTGARNSASQHARPARRAKIKEKDKPTEQLEDDAPSSGRNLRSGNVSGGSTALDTPITPSNSSKSRPRPIPRPCPVESPPEVPQSGIMDSLQENRSIANQPASEHPSNHSQPMQLEEVKENQKNEIDVSFPALQPGNQNSVEAYDSDVIIVDQPNTHAIDLLPEPAAKSEPIMKSEPKSTAKSGSSTPADKSKNVALKHKWDELDSGSEADSPAKKKQPVGKKVMMKEEEEINVEEASEEESDMEGRIDPNQLHFEVPRGNGMHVVKLDRFTSYRTFCHKVADILACSVKELNIGYVAGKARELKGKPTPRVIEEEEDYDEMVQDAVKAMQREVTHYQKEKAKLAAAAKKAKGKAGAPSKKKPAAMQQYVIKLSLTEMDQPNKKGSKHKSANKKLSKRAREMSDGSDDGESIGSVDPKEQLAWNEQLLAKYTCNAHNQLCYPLPATNDNKPGCHVPFNRGDLLLWAKHLAKETADVDLYHPPHVLNLYDPSRKRIKMKEEIKRAPVAPSQNHEGTNAGVGNAPNHAWPTNAMYIPPWYFPQFAPGGAYPGAPVNPLVSTAPTAPVLPAAQTTTVSDPLLSEWLKHCDEGQRGADGHNFAQYLPGFQANLMVRLSDIALLTSAKELIDCIADHRPKMPFGTALRLLNYAKADYKVLA